MGTYNTMSRQELQDFLVKHYIEEEQSLRSIAKELGVSPHTVSRHLEEFGIGIRSKKTVEIDLEELRRLYTEERKTIDQISKLMGCSASVINKHLVKNGIETRRRKSDAIIEALTPEYLRCEYAEKHRSAKEIADELGISKKVILDKLREFDIPVNTQKNASGCDIDEGKLRELYVREGKKINDIASYFDCTASTISKYIRKWGLKEEKRQCKAEQDERLRLSIESLFSEGYNYSETCRELGMPLSTLRRFCSEHDLEPLPMTTCSIEVDEQEIINAYREERKSISAIAEETNLPYSRIRKILISNDVDLRSNQIDVDKDALYQRYVVDKASYGELTTEFDIAPVTLNRLLMRYGIPKHRDVQHAENWENENFTSYVKQEVDRLGRALYVDELASYFDVTRTSIHRKIRALKLEQHLNKDDSEHEARWKLWLDDNGIEFIQNDRTLIAPLELDFYIPQFKVALEINPTFTHNSDKSVFEGALPKPASYHQDKARQCEEHGINLIHVFDWYDTAKLQEILLGICQRNTRIYARNTTVGKVEAGEERRFLEENHLQGYCKSEYCFGLYDGDGDLVSLMSFAKPRFGNIDNAEWELLRFCCAGHVSVVGGASKLFAAFAREHNPETVMSFCNYDISNGGLYKALGFEFSRLTRPSYYWVRFTDSSEYYSWNLILSKGVDAVLQTDYGKGRSNIELMLEDGFVRVYNSGNKVYIWKSGEGGRHPNL